MAIMDSSNHRPDLTEPFFSVHDVAVRLNVSDDTVIRLIQAGDLRALCVNPSNRPGCKRHYRIALSWFMEYVNQGATAGASQPLAPVPSRRRARKSQRPATCSPGAKWFPGR